MAWPPDPIAADLTNATVAEDTHPDHHNELAEAINDLVDYLGDLAGKDEVAGSDMVSGVALWWFDAGGNASAARPAGAAANDVVIWTNTPSEPTNLGARDIWEDAD